mmetsp:Transcript_10357/g.21295  ORF Transcript_10357/g.21295 Transcript_10357/m.21295 type:complete len:286 (-) Transcript_10357:744-1601(-)
MLFPGRTRRGSIFFPHLQFPSDQLRIVFKGQRFTNCSGHCHVGSDTATDLDPGATASPLYSGTQSRFPDPASSDHIVPLRQSRRSLGDHKTRFQCANGSVWQLPHRFQSCSYAYAYRVCIPIFVCVSDQQRIVVATKKSGLHLASHVWSRVSCREVLQNALRHHIAHAESEADAMALDARDSMPHLCPLVNFEHVDLFAGVSEFVPLATVVLERKERVCAVRVHVDQVQTPPREQRAVCVPGVEPARRIPEQSAEAVGRRRRQESRVLFAEVLNCFLEARAARPS